MTDMVPELLDIPPGESVMLEFRPTSISFAIGQGHSITYTCTSIPDLHFEITPRDQSNFEEIRSAVIIKYNAGIIR